MATVKKAQKGASMDSTSYYKQRAESAGNKVAKDDVRKIGSNLKDFATKQREYKAYTNKNKPGYDAQGKSKFEKLIGMKKAKSGASFPDLNKDGKITKADILKGRGVIAKSGMKMVKKGTTAIAMKKAQSGTSVKKASKPMGMNFDKKSYDKLPSYDAKIKADTTKKAKSGGKMKKGC